RDITRRAGVNRATFYRHYQDKFDLLDRYTEAVYALLDSPGGPERSARSGQGLIRMFDHIRANAAFYRVMLGRHGDPAFAETIRAYVEKRMRRALPPTLLRQPKAVGLYLACISSSSLGAVRWWLEQEMPYTSEEMAAISFRLGAANLEAMLSDAGVGRGAGG